MPELFHSEILFSIHDGISMEFNIQYVKDKASMKALIEHGGGLCTLRDDVVHIVSPGATVLNVKPGTVLVSTTYIHDCVKQNCLLDIDEYRFVINESQTSDISDNSQNAIGDLGGQKCEGISAVDVDKSPAPKTIACPSGNHDFDFQDVENPGTSADISIREGCREACVNAESLKTFGSYKETREVLRISEVLNDGQQEGVKLNDQEIVSSSQPDDDVVDLFHTMELKKTEENPAKKDDESASQSDTVSSSADAPKIPANTSAELFNSSTSVPDFASQTAERQQYINDLEKEIEQILKKPSPKSIPDKIALVKYVCTVKKLSPAIALQTLQNF